jgi:hypothetical protein
VDTQGILDSPERVALSPNLGIICEIDRGQEWLEGGEEKGASNKEKVRLLEYSEKKNEDGDSLDQEDLADAAVEDLP